MKITAMTAVSEIGLALHRLGTSISKWAIRHGAEVELDEQAAESKAV